MIRMVVGSLVAGVVMFVWGWLYWGVLVMALGPFGKLDAEAESTFVQAARDALPASGIYYVPDPSATMDGQGAQEAWVEKHKAGPLMEVFYIAEGRDPMAPFMFVAGFLHMVLIAFLLALGMRKGGGCMRKFGCRVGLAFFVAVVAATWVDGGEIIWFFHPPRWEGIQWVYHASGLLLGGIFVALIVRPPRSPNASDTEVSI
jgi:hypothetical protein